MHPLRAELIRFAAVAVLFGLLLSPLSIPYRVLVFCVIALIWTAFENRSLSPLGLRRHSLKPTVAWAICVAVGVIVCGHALDGLLNWLLDVHPDLSGYGALKGNAEVALQLLGYALVSAAIGEEILFRGFLLHQLTEVFGSSQRARWSIILVSSVLFGLAHSIQGATGIVTTGFVGLVFSWAWFRSNRNLWALMTAHALVDSFGIGMLYLGWQPI